MLIFSTMKTSLLRLFLAIFLPLAVAHAIDIQETKIKAENGDPQAQYDLGFVYLNGMGVPQNPAAAVKLLTMAANQGHIDAQIQLGQCYEEGLGVEKDAFQAAPWYEKAANQGDAAAQTYLGMCYTEGRGVMKAEVEAYAYFLIASQSYEGAREQRDILKNRLSKSQKATGQQRAKEIQSAIEEKVKLQAKANNIQTTGFQIGEKYYYNFDDTHDCNHTLEITTNGKKLSIKKLKFYGEAQIHDLDFTGSINPDDKTGDLKLEVTTNDSASISGEVGNIIFDGKKSVWRIKRGGAIEIPMENFYEPESDKTRELAIFKIWAVQKYP